MKRLVLLFILLPAVALADSTAFDFSEVTERGVFCATDADQQALFTAKATGDKAKIDALAAQSCGPLLEGVTIEVLTYSGVGPMQIRVSVGEASGVFWVSPTVATE